MISSRAHRPYLLAALSAILPALAQAQPAPEPVAPPAKAQQPVTLDELYARLKAAEDDAEAKGIAKLIERRQDRSGSATADLLTERARQAMRGKDYPLAIELMDRATTLEPSWSEGWNRRATVFWLLTDHASAIADLKRTLVIEPRHFEAWAALGRWRLSAAPRTCIRAWTSCRRRSTGSRRTSTGATCRPPCSSFTGSGSSWGSSPGSPPRSSAPAP